MKTAGIQELPKISKAGKQNQKARLNRRIWIPAAILLLAAVGGYAAYRYTLKNQAQAAATTASIQTAVARRGELTLYASGTGTVTPASQIAIGFQDSGTLSEILVKVGEKVQAGQVLARLQTNNTAEDIAASIASAELSVLTAQQALEELVAGAGTQRATAMQSVATYAQGVKDAQYQLDNYIIPTAQVGMSAMDAVVTFGKQLDEARAAFEPYKYYAADNPTRIDLKTALDEAQAAYNAAIKRLEYEYTLQAARANLEKSQQDYEKLKDGPDPTDLAIAQAQLSNAQAQLELAKEAQPVEELLAPVDGTVLAIDGSAGENVGSSAFITLADLSQPLVKVYLDEEDMDKVVVGYTAEVVFDALPDETFTGKVVSVNPSLVASGNVTTVEALVQLDIDPNVQQNFPVGMNGAVDVISGRAADAVLVPVEALRAIDTGEWAVFVMENGKPRLRVVTVGLKDVTSAEITSGLEAGEVVSTGVVETAGSQE